MDDRINKIADDVAYMRAKMEVIPQLQEDVSVLKSKADKGIGFLTALSFFSGGMGAIISKVLHL